MVRQYLMTEFLFRFSKYLFNVFFDHCRYLPWCRSTCTRQLSTNPAPAPSLFISQPSSFQSLTLSMTAIAYENSAVVWIEHGCPDLLPSRLSHRTFFCVQLCRVQHPCAFAGIEKLFLVLPFVCIQRMYPTKFSFYHKCWKQNPEHGVQMSWMKDVRSQ